MLLENHFMEVIWGVDMGIVYITASMKQLIKTE